MQNWILKRRQILGLISIISIFVLAIGFLIFFFGEPSEYSRHRKAYYEFIGAWVSLISSVVLLISSSLYFFSRIIFNIFNSSRSGYLHFVEWWRVGNIISKYSLKFRKLINLSFVLSFPVITCGIALINYADSQNTPQNQRYVFEWIGSMITFPALAVLLVTYMLRLRLKHEEIFRSWARFAKWYLLVSAGVLLFGSFDGGGYISMGLDDRESTTWFLSGLFFFISLILISWKWFTLRGKK